MMLASDSEAIPCPDCGVDLPHVYQAYCSQCGNELGSDLISRLASSDAVGSWCRKNAIWLGIWILWAALSNFVGIVAMVLLSAPVFESRIGILPAILISSLAVIVVLITVVAYRTMPAKRRVLVGTIVTAVAFVIVYFIALEYVTSYVPI